MATRNDFDCPTCGRQRILESAWHTCEKCGAADLLGIKGRRGLYHHNGNVNDRGGREITADRHECGKVPTRLIRSHKQRRVSTFFGRTDSSTTATNDTTATNESQSGAAYGESATAVEPRVETAQNNGSAADANGLTGVIIEALKPYVADLLDRDSLEASIREIARAEAASVAPVRIEITRSNGDTHALGQAHAMMPTLLKIIGARRHAYLFGPAGTGKTQGASQAAEALGLPFYALSVGPATTIHEIKGHSNALGEYVMGAMFKAYTQGGVFLIDEIDAANPAALTTINAALANGQFDFPVHGMCQRHPDFVCIAAGNTPGMGATAEYNARAKLDDATRNRFSFVIWDYDPALEAAITEAIARDCDDSLVAERVRAWTRYVHAVRASASTLNIRMTAGTRDIVDGAALIIAGFTIDEVAGFRFWNTLDADTKTKVEAGI